MIHLNVDNHGNDFIRSAPLNVRTKRLRVWFATLAAIRMRKDAARVVILFRRLPQKTERRKCWRPCWRLLFFCRRHLLPISVIYISMAGVRKISSCRGWRRLPQQIRRRRQSFLSLVFCAVYQSHRDVYATVEYPF
ncbi:hypothetical protein KCP74_16600 [Salmonella enterica subsp. enterica]|nr:hypothetical protein KCP74_16600 [Salmonella enterica subsp. enterica]